MFSALIALLFITIANSAYAKESPTYDLSTRSEILSSAESPDCDSGCDNYVSSSKATKGYSIHLSDGETYCVTSNFTKLYVSSSGDGGTLRICGNVTIKSLTFWNYSHLDIEITSGSTLNFNVNTWNPNLSITNWGTLVGSYSSAGDLTNYGTVDASNFIVYGGGTVTNEGTITVSQNLSNSGTLTNTGTLIADKNLTTTGTFNNEGTVDVTKDLKTYGTTTNSGTLSVTKDVSVTGTLVNDGSIDVDRSIYTIWDDATIDNNSTITVGQNLVNNHSIDNSGDITIEGSYTNNWNSETLNSGVIATGDDFTQYGTLTSSGDIIVDDTFSDWWGVTTELEDGALLSTKNIVINSSIIGTGDYSTIYVKEESTLGDESTIAGSITYYDEDGVESSNGTISDSVVELAETNKIMSLNGTDQYLLVNDHSDLDLQNSGTVEAMINLASYQQYAGIIHKGSTPDWSEGNNGLASDEAYFMQMGGDGLSAAQDQIMFVLVDDAYNYISVSSDLQFELDKWYHVVATWDINGLALYVNGVLQNKTDLTITPQITEGDLVVGSQTPETTITTYDRKGRPVQTAVPNYYAFHGSIDNVRIWNKSFTSEEVWSNFGTSYDEAQSNLVLNLTLETLYTNGGNYYLSTSSVEHVANLYNANGSTSDVAATEDIFESDPVLIEAGISKEYEYFIVGAGESLSVTSNFSCNNLIINANSSLYVPDSVTIVVNEDLYIKSNAGGYGQVLLEGNIIIVGEVHVEHAFLGGGVWQFLTVPTTVTDFSILGDTFDEDYAVFYYDESKRAQDGHSDNVWCIPTQLNIGTGYIFAFAEAKSVIFDITSADYFDITNGSLSLDYTASFNDLEAGWNLIGNPFQSVVSWDKVIEAAENDVFENGGAGAAIYFYDNETGNYQSYVSGASTNGLDGTINPMDAFFVKAFADGSQLSMRRNFFPTTLVTRGASLKQDKVLKATINNSVSKDETIIRFNEEASDYSDERFDAYKEFGGGNLCQIYTKTIDNTALSINTLQANQQQVELELYVKCPSTGVYTLDFDNVESFDTEDVYLIDKKGGVIVNLEDEPEYVFTTEESGTLDRFLIVSKLTQLTTSVEEETDPVPFYYYNGVIRVLDSSLLGELSIYNSVGQKVHTSLVKENNINVSSSIAPGVYIVTLGDESRQIVIK